MARRPSERKPVVFAPSILNADLTRLGEEVGRLAQAGASYVHVDVMDGRFVPNISIGIPVVESLAATQSLPLDVHLMIVEPERYASRFVEAGASIVTVHVEATPHLHRAVQQIREAGAGPGVAINPATPLSALDEILPLVDLVLVMTVNPGFGGQTFIPTMLAKIARLRERIDRDGLQVVIEVDGGIKASNIRRVVEAGADIVVAGTAIFNRDQSVADAMRSLNAALG